MRKRIFGQLLLHKLSVLAVACIFMVAVLLIGKTLLMADSENIILPRPNIKGNTSLEEAINSMHSTRKYSHNALTVKDVSQLLWVAGGEKVDSITCASKTIPSGGERYWLKYYLVVDKVRALPSGLYKYIPENHSLKNIEKGNTKAKLLESISSRKNYKIIKSAPAIIIISADIVKKNITYYDRKITDFINIECGHAGQNIYFMAVAKGLGTVAMVAFSPSEVKEKLTLPKNEIVYYIFAIGFADE